MRVLGIVEALGKSLCHTASRPALASAFARCCLPRNRPLRRLRRGAVRPLRASFYGAHDGIRTRDLFLTKEVLYRLSYMGPATPGY